MADGTQVAIKVRRCLSSRLLLLLVAWSLFIDWSPTGALRCLGCTSVALFSLDLRLFLHTIWLALLSFSLFTDACELSGTRLDQFCHLETRQWYRRYNRWLLSLGSFPGASTALLWLRDAHPDRELCEAFVIEWLVVLICCVCFGGEGCFRGMLKWLDKLCLPIEHCLNVTFADAFVKGNHLGTSGWGSGLFEPSTRCLRWSAE